VREQRHYVRARLNAPATFFVKGSSDERRGIAKDISVGGMFLETATPARFGDELIVHVVLDGAAEPLMLPAVVRWLLDGGMGVQFRLLGAVETHIITEIARNNTATREG
jgi:type IV pilus assembly protein PilZ